MNTKPIMQLALLAALLPAAAAAQAFDPLAGRSLEEALATQGAAAPEASPAEERGVLDWFTGQPEPKAAEWTIMVYSSAKNDLERFLLRDINEMELIGSTDKVNIVVEVGRMNGYDYSDGNWTGVRRYLIQKDSDITKMKSKLIQDMGMLDQGDWRTLANFGKWAKKAYPAKKYMLIVANHGSGWEKGVSRGIVENKGISYDEQSGNHINTPQLGLALREMGKVDLFTTDACLMQMAEVVYEIRNYADFIVGSEETEPGAGYYYDRLLGPLAARPGMTPQELGRLTVDSYSDQNDAIGESYTQSLVRGSAAAGLAPVINAFVEAVMAAGERELAQSAKEVTIAYAAEENRDLYDFTRRVVEGSKSARVKSSGKALMGYITGSLVLHSRASENYSKGVAAYFPFYSLGAGYEELAWARDSKWDEFSKWVNQLP